MSNEKKIYYKPSSPELLITPYAWQKIRCFRDYGSTEIGGFGVTSPDNDFLITDFQTVKQTNSSVTVKFDDDSVADFFARMDEIGYEARHFGRIWIHTHPGTSAHPSSVDENCFNNVFGRCNYAIMLIVARDDSTTCALQMNTFSPSIRVQIPLKLTYDFSFEASNFDIWKKEYDANVQKEVETKYNYDYKKSASIIKKYANRAKALTKKELEKYNQPLSKIDESIDYRERDFLYPQDSILDEYDDISSYPNRFFG